MTNQRMVTHGENNNSGELEMPEQESVDPIITDDDDNVVNDDATVNNKNHVENGASNNMEGCTESPLEVKNADAHENDKRDGEVMHEKKDKMIDIESHEDCGLESNCADGEAQNQETTVSFVTRNQTKEKRSKVAPTKKSQPKRKR